MNNKTKHLISMLLACLIAFQTMSIAVFAESEEFVVLEAICGTKIISDAGNNVTGTSTDESVAKFENGQIQAYGSGTAVVTIMSDSGSKTYKVSVMLPYPQPKTAKINKDGVILRKWGQYQTEDKTSTVLNDGDEITILGRVDDKSAPNDGTSEIITQYIKTSGGEYGFVENQESNDRPLADYSIELAIGGAQITGTYNGKGEYHQNQTLASTSSNITISKNADNSSTVTGVSEGSALVTATGGNGVLSSTLVTVYSETENYTASLNQRTVVRQGANEGNRASSVKQKDEIVNIVGQCGDYWRIGDKQYVLKSCADILPDTITLNTTSTTIKRVSTYQLTASVLPDIAVKNIIWTSDDETIATVDGNGLVTGVAAGEATITATTSNGILASCVVTVEEVMPTSITLDCTEKTVNKDEVFTLTSTILPEIALQTVAWSSSDEDVAVVDGGEVTAMGAGTATITATTANGLTATCEVTVKVPATGIDIPDSHVLTRGDSYNLIADLSPEDTTDREVAWSSSDESVATVTQEGKVVAVDKGEATITATIGEYSDECKISVYVPLDKIEMPSEITLIKNATLTLTPKFYPEDTTQSKITWNSSDTAVATVDDKGKVVAKMPGETVVTATTESGTSLKCKVTVFEPISKITVPKYVAIELGKADSIVPTYNPTMTKDYNTYAWSSQNESIKVSGDKNKGTISSAKQGISNISITATSPTSADGAPATIISGATFVSVYEKYDTAFTVVTKKDDVKTFFGAAKKTEDSVIAKKDTALKVIGVCGKFYYVKVLNSVDKYRFVRQKAVKEVTLIHKELLVNQVYKNDELFKTGDNINITSKLLSGECVTISKNIITADKRGKAVVQVKRKNTKTDKKKIYQIHFTVPNYVAKSVGYTNDDVTVYHCAKTTCAIRKLKANTKVVIKAYVGERLKVEYELNGETKKGYVAENKVSWVEVSPIVVAEGEDKEKRRVYFHNIADKELPKVNGNEVVKINKVYREKEDNKFKYFISVKGKSKGFGQLKIEVGEKYKTFLPITVYEPMKVDNARVNKKVNFKSGASDKNENVINFRKFKVDKKLTILGKCNGFFCVKVSSTDIGIKGKGFVNKDRISYLKLNKETCTVSKGKTKKIELKAYNTKASEVEWKNENGKVSFGKQTVSKNNNMRTITYLVKGKAVGTANATIKHKKLTLKDKCFISVYDKITTSPGFMKENGAVRKGAAQVSDNCPKVGDRAKHQKVKVKGKCGDYYFVKYGEKKGFVLKSKVAYLSFKTDKYTMKQYDTKKDLKAKIVNSNQDGKIKFELNKKKLAEIKEVKETKKKVQKPHLYAKKEGKVKITASYTNAGGVTVKKGIEVKINEIELEKPQLSAKQKNDTLCVELSWKSIKNAKEYQVQVKDGENGKYVDLAGSPTKSTNHTTGEGVVGNTYYYRVRAICEDSYSEWSKSKSVNILETSSNVTNKNPMFGASVNDLESVELSNEINLGLIKFTYSYITTQKIGDAEEGFIADVEAFREFITDGLDEDVHYGAGLELLSVLGADIYARKWGLGATVSVSISNRSVYANLEINFNDYTTATVGITETTDNGEVISKQISIEGNVALVVACVFFLVTKQPISEAIKPVYNN